MRVKKDGHKQNIVFVDGSREVVPSDWRKVVLAPPENLQDQLRTDETEKNTEENGVIFGAISKTQY